MILQSLSGIFYKMFYVVKTFSLKVPLHLLHINTCFKYNMHQVCFYFIKEHFDLTQQTGRC